MEDHHIIVQIICTSTGSVIFLCRFVVGFRVMESTRLFNFEEFIPCSWSCMMQDDIE